MVVTFDPNRLIDSQSTIFGPRGRSEPLFGISTGVGACTIPILWRGRWGWSYFRDAGVTFDPRGLSRVGLLDVVFGPGRRGGGIIVVF